MTAKQDRKRIYFLAICGTAMASLAAMLKQKGHIVFGSDSGFYPPMSNFLLEQSIPVWQGYDPNHLSSRPDLVIVGNVISRGNPEIEEILDQQIPYMSLPDALREFFIKGHRSIVVTGTHGKTTTSSLLAWIFQCAGRDPSFIIGGIPNNFNRGFQVAAGKDIIIEGDEYDSAFFDKVAKFLRYMPQIGIINNIEYDHADIYDSLIEIKTAFRRFVNLIPRNGFLAACYDDEIVRKVCAKAFCPVESFGLNASNFWRAEQISENQDGTQFDLIKNNKNIGCLSIVMHGAFNIRNTLAVIAVANHVGIELGAIREALQSYKGVKRRMELKGLINGIRIFDDFGHHPTAIRETLQGFRSKYPDNRIWALFEPRTATTRRSVFQNELVDSFNDADVVVIAPVDRPDKAPPGKVFSCEKLVDDLRMRGKQANYLKSVDQIVRFLCRHLEDEDLVITFSNGSFGGIHQKLMDELNHNKL